METLKEVGSYKLHPKELEKSKKGMSKCEGDNDNNDDHILMSIETQNDPWYQPLKKHYLTIHMGDFILIEKYIHIVKHK